MNQITSSDTLSAEAKMTIGEKVFKLREDMKLTQVQLAEMTKLSASLLSKLERNKVKEVRTDNLRKIARVFSMTLSQLLDGVD